MREFTNKEIKYYEIMELECETPINNRSVGADFYICTSEEKREIENEIAERGNNFNVTELTKEMYEIEMDRIRDKNLRIIAG